MSDSKLQMALARIKKTESKWAKSWIILQQTQWAFPLSLYLFPLCTHLLSWTANQRDFSIYETYSVSGKSIDKGKLLPRTRATDPCWWLWHWRRPLNCTVFIHCVVSYCVVLANVPALKAPIKADLFQIRYMQVHTVTQYGTVALHLLRRWRDELTFTVQPH